MVKHMINVEPSQRYTAEQYLQEWYLYINTVYILFLHIYIYFFISILDYSFIFKFFLHLFLGAELLSLIISTHSFTSTLTP